jgi:hypothetical protein
LPDRERRFSVAKEHVTSGMLVAKVTGWNTIVSDNERQAVEEWLKSLDPTQVGAALRGETQ